jgi:hypothetical protein
MLLPEIRDLIRLKAEIPSESALDSVIQKGIRDASRHFTGRFRFTELFNPDLVVTVDDTGIANLQNFGIQHIDTNNIFYTENYLADPIEKQVLRSWSRHFNRNVGFPRMFRTRQSQIAYTAPTAPPTPQESFITILGDAADVDIDYPFTASSLQEAFILAMGASDIRVTQEAQTRWIVEFREDAPPITVQGSFNPYRTIVWRKKLRREFTYYLDIPNPFSQETLFDIEISPTEDIDTTNGRVIFDAWFYPSIDQDVQSDSREYPIPRLEQAVISKVASMVCPSSRMGLKSVLLSEAEAEFKFCTVVNQGNLTP